MKQMKCALSVAVLILVAVAAGAAQTTQVVAVRAGKLFDPKSGTNLNNQVVLIGGDKITEMQRVKFVMKGGAVIRNDIAAK